MFVIALNTKHEQFESDECLPELSLLRLYPLPYLLDLVVVIDYRVRVERSRNDLVDDALAPVEKTDFVLDALESLHVMPAFLVVENSQEDLLLGRVVLAHEAAMRKHLE